MMPTEFIFSPDMQSSLLTAQLHATVVVVSALIAMISGVLAVYLVKVARTVTDELHQDVAHGGGVLVLGCGLWCGQFLALLARDYGISVTYDAGWMAGSVFMATCVAWLVIDQLVRPVTIARELLPAEMLTRILAGVLAAAGMAAMQYMTATSMQMQATLQYDVWRLVIWLAIMLASCVWLLRWQYAPSAIFSQYLPHAVRRQVIAGALAGLVFVANEYLGVSAILLSGVVDAAYPPATLHIALETVIGALLLFALVIVVHAMLMYRHMLHAFHKGQARMALLMSSSTEGLLIVNPQYVIISANQAAAGMFGWNVNELIGRPVNTLISEFPVAFHTGWHDSFADTVPSTDPTTAAKNGARPVSRESRELFAGDRQGKVFPVRVSLGQADTDIAGAPLIVVAIRDLSAEREALRRERDAKSEMLSVISALTEHTIFSETDSSGTIIRVNEAFVAVSGYRKSELIGQPHSIVGTDVYPQTLWDSMWQNLRKGKSWRHDICNRTPAGETYWLDTVIIPVLDEQSRLRRIIGVHQDITERKNRLASQRLRQGFTASAWSGAPDMQVMQQQISDKAKNIQATTREMANTLNLSVVQNNGY